ncbi:MAG: isoprenyl transferase [Paenibacillus sp. RIFOXYA1_FULL_44_5]|nr:MAG: isoprenyl transferase [Paenibacillus sp. RIFOXYA1_FULL_44_5]
MLKFFKKRNQKPIELASLNSDNIPKHIAIIMDGNGRWAKERNLPRAAGHHSGMKNVKKIAIAANDMGVKILTLYAFSTENWKRPKEEVDYLMKLPSEFFPLEIDDLMQNNVRIQMMGWEQALPEHTRRTVEEAVNRTRGNTGLILNFALNYGSRYEMINGIKHLAQDVENGKINVEQINEALFSQYLFTKDMPDPDLIIRTSGEFRISNFMLWQMAYSELYFTECYWPGFSVNHLEEAISDYQKRSRRYGGIIR